MIQEKLNICAKIIRKFDLGDKDYLRNSFRSQPQDKIDIAWRYGFDSLRHRDVIKNFRNLGQADIDEVDKQLEIIGEDKYEIYGYLFSQFEVDKLKLKEENLERRIRNRLARKYVQIVKSEIEPKVEKKEVVDYKVKKVIDNRVKRIKENTGPSFIDRNYDKLFTVFLCTLLGGFFFYPNIKEGFTPADKLAKEIYETSSYEYRIGAKCHDGWNSKATGRGACSHHGGVSEWKLKKKYRKSYSECMEEAVKRSWVD